MKQGVKKRLPPGKRQRAAGGASRRIVRILQQCAVLALAVFGFLFSLTTGYSLTLLTRRLVLCAVAFIAAFSAAYLVKRRWLALAAVLLAAAVYAFTHSAELMQGGLLLLSDLLDPLGLRLPDAMLVLMQEMDAETALALATRAMAAVLFLETLFAGYAVMVGSSVALLLLSTLPLLLPLPFFALSPAVLPAFGLIGAYLMLYIQNGGGYLPAQPAEEGDARGRRRADAPAPRPARLLLSLAALPVLLLVLLLSRSVLPESGYARPARIEELQDRILSWDAGNGLLQISNDGLTQGAITSLPPIRFTGKTALKIRMSEQRSLYLRGFSGAVYTDTGWKKASTSDFRSYLREYADVPPVNLYALAADASGVSGASYTLAVQNVAGTAGSVFIPNGLITQAEALPGVSAVLDAAFTASGVRAYEVSALPVPGMLSTAALLQYGASQAETQDAYRAALGSATGLQDASGSAAARLRSAANAYLSYVFETDTALPEKTLLAAEKILSTYGLSPSEADGALSLAAICQRVHAFLTAQCSYAYTPDKIPRDQDFTTYFVTESKNGYCVHFATAATVLLRALGVPARYAEGYIVVRSDYEKTPDAEGYIDIEDTHAHAWVEVFDPTLIEWVPVEMTASAGGANEDREQSDAPTPTIEPTATPTPIPTETLAISPDAGSTPDASEDPGDAMGETASPAPSGTPDPSEGDADNGIPPEGGEETPGASPEMGETDAGDGVAQEDPDAGGGAPQGKMQNSAALWLLLLVPLCLGCFVLCLFGWRALMRERRKAQLTQADANAAVLAACRLAVSMLRFAGGPEMKPLEAPDAYAERILAQLPYLSEAGLKFLLEAAQRAKFSGRMCQKEERSAVIAFLRGLRAELPGRLSKFRRAIFLWRYPEV